MSAARSNSRERELTVCASIVIRELHAKWSRIPLGVPRGGSGSTQVDLLHVTLDDDEGQSGTGFTYALGGGMEAVWAVIEHTVRPAVVGSTVDGWPQSRNRVWKETNRLGRDLALAALSAVDIAVWDLRSRRADLPLFRYLGVHHDDVEIYGSGRSTHSMGTDELVQGVRSYVNEGYRAVKLRIGARTPADDVQRVAAVREAVGDGVQIMVDCNERLDVITARWIAPRLAELGVVWLEEPLPSEDIAGYAALARCTELPLAAGEHLHGRHEFLAYLRDGAASILMPDVPLTGGITEWLRLSTIADAYGVQLTPHFLPELHVHLAAATPNCHYIEHFPLLDDALLETLSISNGRTAPPERPGHGLRWNYDALERYNVPT